MKELITRSISGVFIIFAVIASIYFSHISFAVLFSIVVIISNIEFSEISGNKFKPYKYFYAFLAFFVFLISFLVSYELISIKYIVLIIPALFIPAVIELFSKNSSTKSIALASFGIIYTAFPFSIMNFYFLESASGEDYRFLLLSIFIMIWVFDSFAYLVGVKIGKHKLFKSISPKKSWEGFFGGLVFAVLTAYILSISLLNVNVFVLIGMAIIVSVAGTFGDLIESKIKRSSGLKDSGSIIPGHGGILDRFDSILLILPIISVFLILIL